MGAKTLTALRIDPELVEAVDRRAEADGTTRSEVIREAIRSHVEKAPA